MNKYMTAVEWIAFNDEPTEELPHNIAQQITVMLIADVFGREPESVAKDVVWMRNQEKKEA